MKFLIINGPNLNLLGTREPVVYGTQTYDALCREIEENAHEHGDTAAFFQSNHEGALIDKLQECDGVYDGVVINPGAYAHYSYAIADALRAIAVPAAEVHLSDIYAREEFRHKTVTGDACRTVIAGHGFAGYTEAMDFLRGLAK